MTHFKKIFESGTSLPQRLVFQMEIRRSAPAAEPVPNRGENVKPNTEIQQLLNKSQDGALAALRADAMDDQATLFRAGLRDNHSLDAILRQFDSSGVESLTPASREKLAIAFFQFEKQLKVDGLIGPNTRAKLKEQIAANASVQLIETAQNAGKVNATELFGQNSVDLKTLADALRAASIPVPKILQDLAQHGFDAKKNDGYRDFNFKQISDALTDYKNSGNAQDLENLRQQLLALDLYNPQAWEKTKAQRNTPSVNAKKIGELFASTVGASNPADVQAFVKNFEALATVFNKGNPVGARRLDNAADTQKLLTESVGVFTFRADKPAKGGAPAQFVEGLVGNRDPNAAGVHIEGSVLSQIDGSIINKMNNGNGNVVVDLESSNPIVAEYIRRAVEQNPNLKSDEKIPANFVAKLIYIPHCNNETLIVVPKGKPSAPAEKINTPSTREVCGPEMVSAMLGQALIDEVEKAEIAEEKRAIDLPNNAMREAFGGNTLFFNRDIVDDKGQLEAGLQAKLENMAAQFDRIHDTYREMQDRQRAGIEIRMKDGTKIDNPDAWRKAQLDQKAAERNTLLSEIGAEASPLTTKVDQQAIFQKELAKIKAATFDSIRTELRNAKVPADQIDAQAQARLDDALQSYNAVPRIFDVFHRTEPSETVFGDAGKALNTIGYGAAYLANSAFGTEAGARNSARHIDADWSEQGQNMRRDRNRLFLDRGGKVDTYSDPDLDYSRIELRKTENVFSTESAFGMSDAEFAQALGSKSVQEFMTTSDEQLSSLVGAGGKPERARALIATRKAFEELMTKPDVGADYRITSDMKMSVAWPELQKQIQAAPTQVQADKKGRGYYMVLPSESLRGPANQLSRLFTKVDIQIGNEIHNYVVNRYELSEVTAEQLKEYQQKGEVPEEIVPGVPLTHELYQAIVTKGELPMEASRRISQVIAECKDPNALFTKVPVQGDSKVLGGIIMSLLVAALVPGGGCPGCKGGGIGGGDGGLPPVGGGLN